MSTLVNEPKITLNNVETPQTIPTAQQKVLMVGQKLVAGSSTANTLVENIQRGQEDALFGQGSHLAGMVRAFKSINNDTQLDAIPLDDPGGGTALEMDFTLAGTATTAGDITLIFGSAFEESYKVPVNIGDTHLEVVTALVNKANENADSYFTVTDQTLGVLRAVYKNTGIIGNDTGFETIVFNVEGITVTGPAVTIATGTPSLSNLFDPAATIRYQTVVYPRQYDETVLEAFVDPRFNVTNNILDGVGVTTRRDTFATLLSFLNTKNDQNIVVICNNNVTAPNYGGGDSMEFNDVITSIFAAARSLRLTNGSNLSDILSALTSSRDLRGGGALGSLPYFNTLLPRLLVGNPGNGYTEEEASQLIDAGGTIFGENRTRTAVLLGTTVTTRKTDLFGNPNDTWKFLNYVDTQSIVREFFFNNLKADLAQTRLTLGSLVEGRNMQNEASIRALLMGYYNTLASEEFVLTVNSTEAQDFFRENAKITLDIQAGLVTLDLQVPIVTQLREIVGTVQLSFTTN